MSDGQEQPRSRKSFVNWRKNATVLTGSTTIGDQWQPERDDS